MSKKVFSLAGKTHAQINTAPSAPGSSRKRGFEWAVLGIQRHHLCKPSAMVLTAEQRAQIQARLFFRCWAISGHAIAKIKIANGLLFDFESKKRTASAK